MIESKINQWSSDTWQMRAHEWMSINHSAKEMASCYFDLFCLRLSSLSFNQMEQMDSTEIHLSTIVVASAFKDGKLAFQMKVNPFHPSSSSSQTKRWPSAMKMLWLPGCAVHFGPSMALNFSTNWWILWDLPQLQHLVALNIYKINNPCDMCPFQSISLFPSTLEVLSVA